MPSYRQRTPGSRRLFKRALKVFAGGVNHNARFYRPYPLFIRRAKGRHLWDEDGNKYTDYWMGHMALILGHSPSVVTEELLAQIEGGTLYGMGSRASVEMGELVQKTVPCAEMVRFCNTGAEATMYLTRLARGFTHRRVVIKISGGWHGYNTGLNKGVHTPFDRTESQGILSEEQAYVKMVRFNDIESARAAAKENSGDLAAILLEPVLGAGGCIPAEPEYLRGLRELTEREGALLAFDEVITGFRVALGGAQAKYGVVPDIATFGKIAGGGLPLGMVCGRKDIVSLADPRKKEGFVSIGGGTFSENPLTMVAGLATLKHLRRNSARIYQRLDAMGGRLRSEVDRAFEEEGVEAHTTGMGSLFLTHFGPRPMNAEEASAPDAGIGEAYSLDLMEKGIFMLPGHAGGISTVHSLGDIDRLAEESGRFARKLRKRK